MFSGVGVMSETPIKGRFKIPGWAGTFSRDPSLDISVSTGPKKYQDVCAAYRYHPDETLSDEEQQEPCDE